MKLATPALLVLFTAAALPAQRQGMANTDAPTMTTTIAMANGPSVTVKYTAITMAGGKWLPPLMDKEKGKQARSRLNQTAERQPLGSFTVSKDIEIAGKKVAAGEYKLMFTIDDETKWHIVLAPATGEAGDSGQTAGRVDFPLDLKEGGGDNERSRLTLTLMPGDAANAAELHVAFGKMRGKLEVSGGAAAAHDAAGTGNGGNGNGEGGGRRRRG